MPILSVIMREAERVGMRPEGSNPCRGIERYRRKGRERFLSDEEIRRLSAVLSVRAERRSSEVAAVRVLLLTGCRKSEMLALRRSDYREGHLFLRDSKTGPRTVWLSEPARVILDRLPRAGRWMFPAARGGRSRNANWLDRFWRDVRAEAGIENVRIHDLRHSGACRPAVAGFRRRRMEGGLTPWAHRPLPRAGRRQPRRRRVASRAGPSRGLRGQATAVPMVHFYAAAPAHIPPAVDNAEWRDRSTDAPAPGLVRVGRVVRDFAA